MARDPAFDLIDRRLDRLFRGDCRTSVRAVERESPYHTTFRWECICGGHPECVLRPMFPAPDPAPGITKERLAEANAFVDRLFRGEVKFDENRGTQDGDHISIPLRAP